MRKLTVLFLTLLVPAALTVGGCDGGDNGGNNGNGGKEDTGGGMADTTVEDTGGSGMDTTAAADTSGGEDTSGGDTSGGGMDTSEEDAGDMMCMYSQSVDVSGEVQLHPLTTESDMSETVNGLNLSLISAASAIGGSPSVLKKADCNEASVDFTAMDTKASYSFKGVNVSNVITGLVALVDDASSAGSDDFVPTATGLADDFSSPVSGIPAFALSKAAEGAIAQAAGMSAGDLTNQGFILGMAIDASQNPVSGLQVAVKGDGSPISKAIYPNKDLSGTGSATSDNGIFIVPQAGLKEYVLIDSMGTEVSGGQQGASAAGLAFTMTLIASN